MSNVETSPTIRMRISESDLSAWVAQAAPDDSLEYHRGFLAVDRTPFGEPMSASERNLLVRTSLRAMLLADAGFIHLVQRRFGSDRFSYLAVARRPPAKAPASLSVLLRKGAA